VICRNREIQLASFALMRTSGINRLGFNSGGVSAFANGLPVGAASSAGSCRRQYGGKNRETRMARPTMWPESRRWPVLPTISSQHLFAQHAGLARHAGARGFIEDLLRRALIARNRAAQTQEAATLAKVGPDLAERIARYRRGSTRRGHRWPGSWQQHHDRTSLLAEKSEQKEAGGLSGRLCFTVHRVPRRLYRLTKGIALIGCGGVASGADAYAKIRAGASLVQVYSALVFQGPGLARRIKRELAALLRADGFASVADAVGRDHC
jgi:dihydroorotate dehydrogenase